MSNIPPHILYARFKGWKLKGFWNEPKQPQYVELTDEEWEEKKRKELEEEKRIRKQTAIGILENDPELIQEILIELRKKKIKQIRK
jgi:hypothetical protein